MKRTNISRHHIVRAIQAACIAIALSAAQRVQADPPLSYTPPYYTINGSTVTGSGTSDEAFFNDYSSAGYTVTVQANANLSTSETNEILFDHGTVTNNGTLGSDTESTILIANTGTVNNSAGATINSGVTGIEIDGNGTVNNAGTIHVVGTDEEEESTSGISIEGTGTVNNSGLVDVSGGGFDTGITIGGQPSSITNSGTINVHNTAFEAIGVVSTGTFTNTATGVITAGSSPDSEEENFSQVAAGVEEFGNSDTVNNAGQITAYALTGFGEDEELNVAVGIILADTNNTVVNNTGSIRALSTTDGVAAGILFEADNGTVNNNGGLIVGDATYEGIEPTVVEDSVVSEEASPFELGGYGIYFAGNNGTVNNTGEIDGYSNEEEGGIGVYFTGKGTVNNAGFIYGDSYGVYANKNLTVNNIGENAEIAGEEDAIYAAHKATVYNSGLIDSEYGPAIDIEGKGTIVNSGDISSDFDNAPGIYMGKSSTVYNTGYISGSTGVYLNGNKSTIITAGGVINGEEEEESSVVSDVEVPEGDGSRGDSIVLAGKNSTADIVGHAVTEGTIEGTKRSLNNTLNFNLSGLTPQELASFQAYVAAHPHNGTFSFTKDDQTVTYQYENFHTVNDDAVSLELSTDPGLHDLAVKLDEHYLPQYDLLFAKAAFDPEGALNQFSGREFYDAFATVNLGNVTAFDDLADSRAFDLRHGTGGFDLSQLRIVPGSMIASLGDTEGALSQMLGSARLGGATMSDSKDAKEVNDGMEPPRWGAWASGTVTLADESTSYTSNGYNATTGSPSIGADYRVTRDLAVGALFNFDTTGADFADGSHLNEQSELLGFYATWAHKPWFINSLVGFGYNAYDNQRIVTDGTTASSHPQGDEVLANLNGGYEFKFGRWELDPEAGFDYTHLAQDGYNESGGGVYNLNVADQVVDSFRTKVGFRALGDYKWDGIRFSPEIHADWYHECLDADRGVNVGTPGAPVLGSFVVQTDKPERDFALVGAGLSATPAELHDAITFFVNYDAQVGQADYIAHTFNGGLRIGF